MADAQPLRALANVVETFAGNLLKPEASGPDNDKPKIAFLNARPVAGTLFGEADFRQLLLCEQPFRPQYLALQRAAMAVEPDLSAAEYWPEGGFDACLVIADKFRAINEEMISKAQRIVRKGGMIIVAGAKNTGIASIRKRIAAIYDDVESLSKYHSMVFWFANARKRDDNPEREPGLVINTENRTYRTMAGLFSANRIDPGSAMLAGHFDDSTGGKVADLGAGWGYLSGELLARSNNLTGLDLYEADWHGVEACKYNLRTGEDGHPNRVETKFYWHDVAGEPIGEKYDRVIMNPPFHSGRLTSLDLGQAFIRAAASILKPGGKMLMVANRHLAYERIISGEFSSFSVLEEAGGFKVIIARK